MSRPLSTAARVSLRSQRAPGLARAIARLHARAYRLTGGRGVGRWFGAPVLVLETVGRRSGRRRRTPILYLERGEQLIVLAANGGSDRVPAWWLNLRAAGGGRVTLHGTTWAVTPRVLDGDEYERTWAAFARMYPAIDEYRTFTERDLPLVALHPSTGGV
ncbi:MAG: nitroreductase family deazaflavin-dependent oxidoreductase [Solirubrobacterales bacterium]|nr:nitroreductase family deazaflavin-dependent oxidoreductase [Solirubrobacterales bacterium]